MFHPLAPILFLFLAGLSAQGQSTLNLVIELTKPPSAGAMLNVLLCPTVNCWATDAGGITRSVAAQFPTTRITLTDLPAGDFAVKVYVDDNNNGKLDTNVMGIPTEPFGFGNDAMRLMGPPYFDQARFTLREGMNVQRIKMR